MKKKKETQASEEMDVKKQNTVASSTPEPDEDSFETEIIYFDDEETDTVTGSWKKRLWLIIGIIAALIAVVYIGISVYFMNHFYYNTQINGVNFSMKSAEDVKNHFKTEVQGYSLTIKEKGGLQDTILGTDIGLAYQENDDIENALKKQSPFLWPMAFFSANSVTSTIRVDYDEAKLTEEIQKLQCVKAEQTEPQNAYPKFDGTQYIIEPEVLGTKVNMDTLKTKIIESVSAFRPELDMEQENCYAKPKFTSDSAEVLAARDTLNNYCKASITYELLPYTEVVDKTLISSWLTCDADMNVTFNEDAVSAYMADFGRKYDTVGTTRSITTPWGKSAEVYGGTYGWSIDEAGEKAALIEHIKKGEVLTKQPAYAQTAVSHGSPDWGSTYVEVDLSAQHMWYIIDGAVVFETDVVTGKPSTNHATPAGIFHLISKSTNATLVGNIVPETGEPEYRTPVDYWMPVTWSGVGFHDANWQSRFGGDWYLTNGSHGCINMPVGAAGTFYSMVTVGTPVIMHY